MRYLTIFIALIGLSCCSTPKQEQQQITEPLETEQPSESNEEQDTLESPTAEISISDEPLSFEILKQTSWRWEALPNCFNFLEFHTDSTGSLVYECEIDEIDQMKYLINGDTLLASFFYTPHVDNPTGELRKRTDAIYRYTGNSLIRLDRNKYMEEDLVIEYIRLTKK
ncbi:hypothetical protein [Marinoscillum sp. 108]|uniref:hypothetical protein n=1 Tax=Marinoscillum sp. 108 TaxID=2653151 RepID=UPI00135B315D|nr:hypothetical protein [Marinoscillum sp. 108]